MATPLDEPAKTGTPTLPDTPPDGPVHHPVFPLILGASLIVAIVVACTTHQGPEAKAAAPAAAPAETPAPAPAAAAASSDGLETLETHVDELSGKVKDLGARLESLPRPEPAADLASLRTRIDEMAKSTAALAPLSRAVDSLEERIGSLDKALADIRTEIASLKTQTKETASDVDTPSTSGVPRTAMADPAVLDQGSQLFLARKYKDASDVFRKVTETNPDDARGWYYAALSAGLSTGNWKGESVRLVTQGVEREKAGTPETATIDSAFASLTMYNGKAWLDFYRKTAKK